MLSISAFPISAALFQYYEEHPYPFEGQIMKSIICVEFSARLTNECDAKDKLTISEFCCRFNIKMAIVTRFPFLRVLDKSGDS
jgi:hypothetical protein